jgi:hypothetical protein
MKEVMNQILEQFQKASLSEAEGIGVNNRTDTKYLFSEMLLPDVLKMLADEYRILETDKTILNSYENSYYDTSDFNLYLNHHNQRANRYKVRYRKYLSSGKGAFEIKEKTNKDRTFKHRLFLESKPEKSQPDVMAYVAQHTNYTFDNLHESLLVSYKRLCLINSKHQERVTIDLDLVFKTGSQTHKLNNIVIAEVKQSGKTESVFRQIMHRLHINETSVSKYCLGIIFTRPWIKHNNFKPLLQHINNLTHAK